MTFPQLGVTMLAYFTFTKMVEVAPDVSEANELCCYADSILDHRKKNKN